MELEIKNLAGSSVGKIDWAALDAKDSDKALAYQALRRSLAGLHHGTAKVKKRSEVCFTTKKLYRQKGTGRARHGSKRSRPFVGGGVVFGPVPRSYAQKLPKKMKKLAFRRFFQALIDQKRLLVIDKLECEQISTKKAQEIISKQWQVNSIQFVDEAFQEAFAKSFRNLKMCTLTKVAQLRIENLLQSELTVFSKKSLDQCMARWGKESAE